MSANTYLLTPKAIKDRTQLHTNTDDKLIYPDIKAVQDMYIMPLLGSTLFEKIQNDIEADTLTGNYLILMRDYIADAMCWLVLAEMPDTLNYQLWNTGVAATTADKTVNADNGVLHQLRNKYRGRAEHYMKRARMYLLENYTLFNEYNQPGTGIDVVVPEQSSFTNPIFLGYESELPRDSYSLRNKDNQRVFLPNKIVY